MFILRPDLSTEKKPDTGFQQHNSSRHANNRVRIVFSSGEYKASVYYPMHLSVLAINILKHVRIEFSP